MLTIYHKGKDSRDLEHRKITTISAGCWVHVEQPTASELRRLAEELELDEGLLADATDPYEVPRVEQEDDTTYVFTRVPYQDNGDVRTTPVVVIMAKDVLVTITQRDLAMWQRFFTTRIDFLTTQRTKLFFLIFREINLTYQRFLTQIGKSVRQTTVRLEQISNSDIVQFVRFEQSLNDFMSALVPTKNLLLRVASGRFFALHEEDQDLIEDLSLSNGQLIEACSANLKTITNVRGAYSNIMTNNLNHTITLLTVLTIVLTVPTMIASFFGMNVKLPFGLDHGGAFWWIIGISLILSGVLLWGFRNRKWE